MGEYIMLACKIILIIVVLVFTVVNLRALGKKPDNQYLLAQIGLGILLAIALVYKLYIIAESLGYFG